MPKYQIISPHEPSECLRAMEEMLAHDPRFVDEMVVSCHFGSHTSYALMEASSEEEARGMLPAFLKNKARVVEVEQVTPEHMRSGHNEVA